MRRYSSVNYLVAWYSLLFLVVASTFAAPASADLNSLKLHCEKKYATDDPSDPTGLPYRFCRDGVPQRGGRTPNEGAANAVPVPEKYVENEEPPTKAQKVDDDSGADKRGEIALDLDVSLPPENLKAPASGYPLIVMIHGCCWGDKTTWEADSIGAWDPIESLGPNKGYDDRWHYNNAWFAARGYVVLNYTSRGFVNLWGQGSTGETQLDSRKYELKDLQYLAGLLADEPFFNIDPQKVVVTGGCMGGGLSWLALTEPHWKSPAGKTMRLAAVAPRNGWTDLLYSLVPTGMHKRDELPPDNGSADGTSIGTGSPIIPFGFAKLSIDSALLAQGTLAPEIPRLSSHATFAKWVLDSYNCLTQPQPIETSEACIDFRKTTARELLIDRSAYYQNDYFTKLKNGEIEPVPVFSAGTLTDPLFTSVEHQQMAERLRKFHPGYPVQEYYGDYQHFVANKPKEWGDVCCSDGDNDRHLCRSDEYTNLNRAPRNVCRCRETNGSTGNCEGVNTRLNQFIDYYANPPGDSSPLAPSFDVTASLQVCKQNASELQVPADEAGPRYTAPSFAGLAPNSLRLETTPENVSRTSNLVWPNPHAWSSDPIGMLLREEYCIVENSLAGPGVATYQSGELPHAFTMIGRTRLTVTHTEAHLGEHPSDALQLNVRLYDVYPATPHRCSDQDSALLVDRGVRRVATPNETTSFDLDGNGWLFAAGHCIRVEVTQDDQPYVKASAQPSSLSLTKVTLDMPVRETSPLPIHLHFLSPMRGTSTTNTSN